MWSQMRCWRQDFRNWMVCIRILRRWREAKVFFIECLPYPFCSFEMPFLVYFQFVELLIQQTLSLTREDEGYLKWKVTHSRGASKWSCFPLLYKPSSLPKIARHMLVSSCLFCGIHPTVRNILPTYSVSFVVVEISWSPIQLSSWKTWATNSLVVFTNRFSPFMEEPWPGQDKLVFREKNKVPWCAHK